MARYLSEQQNATGVQTFSLLAGNEITSNDILQLGQDGRVYPVDNKDYAEVANCTYGIGQTSVSTGQIVAHTQVVGAVTNAIYRQALLRGDDGSIYTLTSQNNAGGLMLSKYSASGALLSKVDIDTTSTAYAGLQMFFLSSGDICACAAYTSGYTVKFAIFGSQNLTFIKPLTIVSTSTSGYFGACALSQGGFALVLQPSGINSMQSQLSTYDSVGNVVLAPVAIWTRTGTSGTQYHNMQQLSDGNLIVTSNSLNTVSSIGIFHGIVTTSGGSVLPFTNLDGASPYDGHCELSVMDGYYALSKINSSSYYKVWIFNNGGTLQGNAFNSSPGTSTGATLRQKLLNDGHYFYFIWSMSSSGGVVQLTKLPVSGTGYTTTNITTSPTSQYDSYIDAFYENGMIVCVAAPASGAACPVVFVINVDTGLLIGKSLTTIGVVATNNAGMCYRIIPGGDFSFICMYEYTGPASTNLCVGKYASTAILGVAQQSASAGDIVRVAGVAGAYASNFVRVSASKAFDHSATNIIGNKGTMLTYGVVLKGL